MSNFKTKYNEQQRMNECEKILKKYPDRIPIIVNTLKNINLDRFKYLVPSTLTVGEFMHVIRKRIKINPEENLYLFINNELPPMLDLLNVIYEKSKDKDGFLYIDISLENTFG
jgi:GABA(A) receptor-associated protein